MESTRQPAELRRLSSSIAVFLDVLAEAETYCEQAADVNRVVQPEYARRLDQMRSEIALARRPGRAGSVTAISRLVAELLGETATIAGPALLERCRRLASAIEDLGREWNEVCDAVEALDGARGVLYPELDLTKTPEELRRFADVCRGDPDAWDWHARRVLDLQSLDKVNREIHAGLDPDVEAGEWRRFLVIEQRFAELNPELVARLAQRQAADRDDESLRQDLTAALAAMMAAQRP